MKKIVKSPNKRVVICIALCLAFHILFWPFAYKATLGKAPSCITETVDIYIPDGIPYKFKSILSIDIADYWIFRLNKKEQAEMEKDLEINNWHAIDDEEIMVVEESIGYDAYSDMHQSINEHKCYIYTFDYDKEIELPDNNKHPWENECYNWLIFIYDTESNYYYIIHKSK